ncbi:hypothetical protein GGR92_002803 [Spirosoma lacussanchae]|uniref:hypothetical protein n=1 Tax=Spirosoma lacussanchae TaxID=1884249 RepID=UPI001109919B|nr:hypothetical protein [Spirosoma lacussanchae]
MIVAALLSSCTRPEPVAPGASTPHRYVLTNIRYFLDKGDYVDTTTIQLTGASVQNPGVSLVTQSIKEEPGELVKTSHFMIDSSVRLPEEIDLSTFAVSVPQHWYGNGLFGHTVETYPLSTTRQQKPYVSDPGRTIDINVPPRSRIDISRQIDAYQLTCSFDGMVENTTTGQRYRLTGKWKGLLRYNNMAVTLKQSAL